MTSLSRRLSRRVPTTVIYAGLVLGALITLLPFALGLLTSFTSAHQFATGTPLQLPTHRRWPITPTWAVPGSAGRRW